MVQDSSFLAKWFCCCFFWLLCVSTGCQLRGYACLESKDCQGLALCEQGWCVSYECLQEDDCEGGGICKDGKCSITSLLPQRAEKVQWTRLIFAKAQDGRLLLENSQGFGVEQDFGFYGQGYASKGLGRGGESKFFYTLTGGEDHYYVGLAAQGGFYAFKIEEGFIKPTIFDSKGVREIMKNEKFFSYPFQRGDQLSFWLDAQGAIQSALNGQPIEIDFQVRLEVAEVAVPKFRFWPGYVRQLFPSKAFLLNPSPALFARRAVLWDQLEKARLEQGKIVFDDSPKVNSPTGKGHSLQAISYEREGSLQFPLVNVVDHYFVGVSYKGQAYLFKAVQNTLIPYIDTKIETEGLSFPFQPGEVLSFFFNERRELLCSINDRLMTISVGEGQERKVKPYRFGLSALVGELTPTFRFYPGQVRGVNFEEAFFEDFR